MPHNAFPPVHLEFDGERYTVKSDRVWGLIGTIEDHITLPRLAHMMSRGDMPRYRLSEAIAAALNYAGHDGIDATEVAQKLGHVNLIDQAQLVFKILGLAEVPEDMREEFMSKEVSKKPGKPKRKKPAKPPTKSG